MAAGAGSSGSMEPVAGLAWQVGLWDRMSDVYQREISRRFAPVVAGVLARAALQPGERVVDVGTGTGGVARGAARGVAPGGSVLAIDPSPEMLRQADAAARSEGLTGIRWAEGRAEAIPADDGAFAVALASLSLMFALDRPAAARELARVLRPGGRFVASVWGGPAECDLVLLQGTAGSFAPPPPVPGIWPGALADPTPMVAALADAGISCQVEAAAADFDCGSFDEAWTIFAGVTAANLAPERQAAAREATRAALGWTDPATPRRFRNTARFLVGERR